MRQVRVYSADPLAAHSEQELGRAASAHVLRVLRLRAGDALTLFDGRGGEYPARLVRTGRAAAVVEVGEHLPLERESPLAITLLLCHMYLETKTTELVDSLEVASLKFLNSITERREAVAEPADAALAARTTERILGAAHA